MALQQRYRARDRLRRLTLRREVAIDVIHQRRVERLLGGQRRLDQIPHERRHPAAPPAREHRAGRTDLPPCVERRDLCLVGSWRRVGKVRKLVDGGVECRQRLVVTLVGFFAGAFEARQVIFADGTRA
jgi:hypothetical protein